MIRSANNRIITKNGTPSCSCCTLPSLFFEVGYASTYCENQCGGGGVMPSNGGTIDTSESTTGPCAYTAISRAEDSEKNLIAGDLCKRYLFERRIDDYTMVRLENFSEDEPECIDPKWGKHDVESSCAPIATSVDEFTGFVYIDCNCNETINETFENCCPANLHSVTWIYSEEVSSCPTLYTPYYYTRAQSVFISYLKSRNGDTVIADKAKYSISQDQLALLPAGKNVKIKITKTPYFLYEGSCNGWYKSNQSSETFKSYAGGELELSADEDFEEQDPESEIYGYEITASIVIE